MIECPNRSWDSYMGYCTCSKQQGHLSYPAACTYPKTCPNKDMLIKAMQEEIAKLQAV